MHCVAGLAVFAIGPCTLAQGQTLVAQAGGNTALALMLLVVTNILAVFISPFLVQAILSTRFQAGGISLQPGKLLINLVVTILSPALLGKARPPALIHPSLPSAALVGLHPLCACCKRNPTRQLLKPLHLKKY
jgi:predicted Na+-dependent transporter